MSTCNRLDLQTLGSQPIMPKNLPNHFKLSQEDYKLYLRIESLVGNKVLSHTKKQYIDTFQQPQHISEEKVWRRCHPGLVLLFSKRDECKTHLYAVIASLPPQQLMRKVTHTQIQIQKIYKTNQRQNLLHDNEVTQLPHMKEKVRRVQNSDTIFFYDSGRMSKWPSFLLSSDYVFGSKFTRSQWRPLRQRYLIMTTT